MSKLTFGKTRRRMNYDLLREVCVWGFQILLVCFIAFILVWYFGQRVSVIGDSMNPKLENGDITLMNKVVYKIGTPKRGDVIAFKPNGNENAHYYVKRIIGLPGETVEVKKGAIYINGKKIKERYKTTELEELGLLEKPVKLKSDEYFVLGDDRTNSEDSRYADIGNVKRSEIDGKIWFVTRGSRWGFVR